MDAVGHFLACAHEADGFRTIGTSTLARPLHATHHKPALLPGPRLPRHLLHPVDLVRARHHLVLLASGVRLLPVGAVRNRPAVPVHHVDDEAALLQEEPPRHDHRGDPPAAGPARTARLHERRVPFEEGPSLRGCRHDRGARRGPCRVGRRPHGAQRRARRARRRDHDGR